MNIHVDKNSTPPTLSSASTHRSGPLRTGFSGKLKIWFIFKIRDANIVPWHKERKGNREDMCMTTYESWVHAQAERSRGRSKQQRELFTAPWFFPRKYRKSFISFKKEEGRYCFLNLEYTL